MNAQVALAVWYFSSYSMTDVAESVKITAQLFVPNIEHGSAVSFEAVVLGMNKK